MLLSLCGHTVNARASGPEFSWVPVDASVPFTTAQPDEAGEHTEIILPAGTSPQIVEFELRLSGWALLHIGLGGAQATLDETGLLGSNANPPQPGLDLTVLNNQPWRENPGGNGIFDGAFIVTDTCHDAITGADAGIPCASIPDSITWPACPPLPGPSICSDRDDFAFYGNLNTATVSTGYGDCSWGAVSNAGQCPADDGSSYYMGTLIMNVPADVVGTYTFGFDPAVASTFVNGCVHVWATPLRTPGHVTLQDGACCTLQPGGGTPTCSDAVFREDCQDLSDIFLAGKACDDPGFECPACAIDAHCADGVFCNGAETCDAAAGQCRPGSNPCTALETCDESTGTCRAKGACCDRANGTCVDNESFDDCPAPLAFQEGVFLCADLPDSDGDGLLDCLDQCPGANDAVFAPDCAGAIPTTTAWGLVITALLLLIVGKVCFGRRATVSE